MIQIEENQIQSEEAKAKYEWLKAYKTKEDILGIEHFDLVAMNEIDEYKIICTKIHYEAFIREESSDIIIDIPQEVEYISIAERDSKEIDLTGKHLIINFKQCKNKQLTSMFRGIKAKNITLNIGTKHLKSMLGTFKDIRVNKLIINTADGFENLESLNNTFEDSIIAETNLFNYKMSNLDKMIETFKNTTYNRTLKLQGMPKLRLMDKTFYNAVLMNGIDTSGLNSDRLNELSYAFQFRKNRNTKFEVDLSKCNLSRLKEVKHNLSEPNIKFKLDTSQLGRLEKVYTDNATAHFAEGNIEIETTSKEKLLDLSSINKIDSAIMLKIKEHNISKVRLKVGRNTDMFFNKMLKELKICADGVLDITNVDISNNSDEINTYRTMTREAYNTTGLAEELYGEGIHKIVMRKRVYELMQKCYKRDIREFEKAKVEIKAV